MVVSASQHISYGGAMVQLRVSSLGLGVALLCAAACQRSHSRGQSPGDSGEGTREDAAAFDDPRRADDAAVYDAAMTDDSVAPMDAEVVLDAQVSVDAAAASGDAALAMDAAIPHDGTADAHVSGDPDAADVEPEPCVDDTFELAACDGPGVGRKRCVAGQWSAVTCAPPTPHFIPIPSARDIVHDAKRNRLYVTMAQRFAFDAPFAAGGVLVYDLANETLEEPLLKGSQRCLGIDLSPDGDRLIVADGTIAGDENHLHLIDIDSGEVDTLDFELEDGEGGMFTALFISDDEVLATSTYQGSGWVPLRRVDLVSGEAEIVASVTQNTMLARSADGSTVAFAQANISSGAWGVYAPSEEAFEHAMTDWFVYEIAISRNAEQIAVPTYGGLFVFDGALEPLATLGYYSRSLPISAVYSPVADEVYFAWYDADVSIDAYSTETLEPVRTIAAEPGKFDWTGNHAFDNGRLRISRDGTLLFATTATGIAFYPTGL